MANIMKMRLKSFLYCFQLETGGLFFGWFGIIGSLIVLVLFALAITGIANGMLSDESLQQMGFGDSGTTQDQMNTIRTGFKSIIATDNIEHVCTNCLQCCSVC